MIYNDILYDIQMIYFMIYNDILYDKLHDIQYDIQ